MGLFPTSLTEAWQPTPYCPPVEVYVSNYKSVTFQIVERLTVTPVASLTR